VIDLRLRRRVPAAELEGKQGKILGPEDFNLLLTGPAFVRMPDNRPLCVYLPGVLREEADRPGVYGILHSLGKITTRNRGMASGTRRLYTLHAQEAAGQGERPRSESRPVSSVMAGAFDPAPNRQYCRLTSWTGRNLPQWQQLRPLLQAVAEKQRQYVGDRAAAQQAAADRAHPAWVVPGTPFSTVTVNNTYPTGVHTDRGDLDAGFSALAVLRRGTYSGGHLVFPEYRTAVDLQHGDLLLMDAHQWHGNTALVCACGRKPNGACRECGAERISLVAYFRTKIADCGSPEEELRRANGGRA
jgi:hypothetical protein